MPFLKQHLTAFVDYVYMCGLEIGSCILIFVHPQGLNRTRILKGISLNNLGPSHYDLRVVRTTSY